jgi:Cu(I)/Ag(I) efflux system membrane fusion protein
VNNLGVRTTTARYKALHTKINTVGYVTYNEDKLVHIHPRVQGWIEKLHVKATGDTVKKNQPLYDIYSPELVNAQEELLLALDRKNSRLITASENRLSALQLPKSAIEKLKKTKKVQQNITFYSPQNGVVENLNIREGFFVKPGSTLMAIGDLSDVWVEAEVFERQAGQVKNSTPVTMTLDYLPGKTWEGKVDYIYPTLDAKTRTVKVRLRFDNEEGEFKPNMFAQIAIHTTGDEQALLIPKEALIRTGNQDRVVLALGEGSFKSVEVSVGRYDSESVEILQGLSEGERVVSSAQFLLDSESSKSSDFKRMNHETAQDGSTQKDMGNSKDSVSSATVNGTVVSVMADHRMVTIDREAILKWGREADRVDFIVDENVDIALFSNDAYVMFTFEIRDGNFIIVSAMAMDMPKTEPVIKDAANDKGE